MLAGGLSSWPRDPLHRLTVLKGSWLPGEGERDPREKRGACKVFYDLAVLQVTLHHFCHNMCYKKSLRTGDILKTRRIRLHHTEKWASLVAQLVNNPPAMQETLV